MRVFAETRIPGCDQRYLDSVRRLLSLLGPEDTNVQTTSCHTISYTIHALLPALSYQSGHYNGRYDHSWLRTPEGHIIDAYPVGCIGGPLLLAELSPCLYEVDEGVTRTLWMVDKDEAERLITLLKARA